MCGEGMGISIVINSFKGLFFPFPFLSKVGKKEPACLIKIVLKLKIFVAGCIF